MQSKKENQQSIINFFNNIIKDLFICVAIILTLILLLLNLLPILKTDYHLVSTYNGYSSLFFLQDKGDILYYSMVSLLFYHLFLVLIFLISISCFFIKNERIKKREKLFILISYILSSILLLTSFILSKNTLTNIKTHFGYYIILVISIISSISETIIYLKESKRKITN